ncbi:MAG: type 1 glutamine amidotransferase [Actinomycetota bacterium]
MPTAAVIANPKVGAELGHLGPWLAANDFTVTRLVRDEVLPVTAADDADLVIILGSVWTMTRTMDAPTDPPNAAAAIAAEVTLAQHRVAQDRPLLGLCFGGQLLSKALGGEVTQQDRTVIAWETPDTDIPEMRAPRMLLHQDRFTLPDNAELLAEAEHATLGFRYGRAWGLQFHAEVDAHGLQGMFEDLQMPQWQWQQYIDALNARTNENRIQAHALFDRFWSEVSA